MVFVLLYLGVLFGVTYAATPAQWRSRSIYQVMTDRFARTDQSTSASCPPGFGGYCGGTWAGLTEKLDYIQVSFRYLRLEAPLAYSCMLNGT